MSSSERQSRAIRFASQARVGDWIPAIHAGGQRTVVQAVRPDGNGLFFTFAGDGQEYRFGLFEEFNFPRRADGSTASWLRDWAYGIPIDVRQLMCGDRIPAMDATHPGTWHGSPVRDPESGYGEMTDQERVEALQLWEEELAETAWTVKRIGTPIGHRAGSVLTLAVMDHERALRKFAVTLGQPLSWPLAEWEGVGAIRPVVTTADVTTHGPYLWIDDDGQVTGLTAMFAVHPRGVGRWPAIVAEYRPGGSGMMRPPAVPGKGSNAAKPDLAQWQRWKYQGQPGENHPQEPLTKKHDQVMAEVRAFEASRAAPAFTQADAASVVSDVPTTDEETTA